MPNFKAIVKKKILKEINSKAIAPFIVQEIDTTLDFFNTFRLENILDNIVIFTKFIENLDQHNTNLYIIHNSQTVIEKQDNTDRKESWYISTTGWDQLSLLDKQKFNTSCNEEKNQKTILIKWWLLLSICDFAQWGDCRIQNKYEYKVDSEYNVK